MFEGKEYRRIVGELKEGGIQDYATLTFNTDGAPVFKSSFQSIWPMQFIVNETPIEERLHNPILCGLYFGKGKP